MNNAYNHDNKNLDNEKIKAIIRIASDKIKEQEKKGLTKGQVLTTIVNGIEGVLKHEN